MPSPPTVDDQLAEFLEWQADARRKHKTVEAVYDLVAKVSDKQDKMMVALQKVANDRLEDAMTVIRHGKAIKSMQGIVETLTDEMPAVPNWRASKSEISGHHDITAIQKKIEEREKLERDEETWWRRQRWLWFGAAVAAVFAICLGGCLTYTMKRIDSLEKSLNHEPPPHTDKH